MTDVLIESVQKKKKKTQFGEKELDIKKTKLQPSSGAEFLLVLSASFTCERLLQTVKSKLLDWLA